MIRTARLILDTWEPADAPAFRPIATDPEVMRYITGGVPWSDEQIESFLWRQIDLHNRRGFCRWKISDAQTHEMLGFCGPGIWRDATDPEIGWWLARRHWGKGLASEAARAALADAFDRAGLPRLISVAMPENAASIAIMKKIGLRFDAEFESEGTRLVRYAIGRDQFATLKENEC